MPSDRSIHRNTDGTVELSESELDENGEVRETRSQTIGPFADDEAEQAVTDAADGFFTPDNAGK